MTNAVLIPEYKLNRDYKKKVFINENSKKLNLQYFSNSDSTIKYLNLNREERIKETEYTEIIISRIIDIVSDALNKIHNEKCSKRYWEIILRPWLHVFICAVRNRYRKIELILNNSRNINFIGSFSFDNLLIPQDLNHFNKLHCTNDWNNYIYFKIFEFFSKKKILKKKYTVNKKKLKFSIVRKKAFKHHFDKVMKYLDLGLNKTFIHESGMNFLNEFFLNLTLLQIPRFYYEEKLNKFSFNYKLRNLFKNNLNQKNFRNNDKFMNFILKILPFQFPLNALEGYKYCKKRSKIQKYPKNPKVIFTSNSFFSNEMFKFYTAQMIDKKNPPKYIIGQHGNAYNTDIFNKYITEFKTPDFFLNWGVKKKNQISFCNFISKEEIYRKSKKKYLLIILRSRGEKRTIFDQELHNKQYEDCILKFLKGINSNKISNVVIKPHFNHNLNSPFYKKIKLNYPKIQFLDPNYKVSKFFNKCRLVIYNYDATSYLQLLSSNFPTIAIWPGHDSHVVSDMRPIYRVLKKNFLWSSNPEIISRILNRNWNDITNWWFKKKRQNAISLIKNSLCKPRKFFFLFELAKIISLNYKN